MQIDECSEIRIEKNKKKKNEAACTGVASFVLPSRLVVL
jgi:hypothetical protein